MAFFVWLGGPLDNPFSWTQPDPDNPVLPGPGDTVTIGGGDLTGALSVFFATVTGDLLGSLTASSMTVGAMTIEAGATLTATSSETLSGNVTVKGGTNTVTGVLLVKAGTVYELSDGTVTVSPGSTTPLEFIEGGTFKQTGGTHTIDADFEMKDGTYLLSGGTMNTVAEFIGQHGTSTFTQTGGKHTVVDRVVLGISVDGPDGSPHGVIGSGTYTLGGKDDASLSASTIFVGSDPDCTGVFNFNVGKGDNAKLLLSGGNGFPGLIVGGEGIGKFTQGGGDLVTTLQVGRRSTGEGTYRLDGGTLSTPSMSGEIIGDTGKGTFIQTTGTNKVDGILWIGVANQGTTSRYVLGGDANTKLSVANASVELGVKIGATGEFDLNLDKTVGTSATVSIDGAGGPVIGTALIVGDQGTGILKQGGGQLTVNNGNVIVANQINLFGLLTPSIYSLAGDANTKLTVNNGKVTIGAQAGAIGFFDFNVDKAFGNAASIQVTTNFGASALIVGDQGNGTFRQGGGALTLKVGDLVVGNNNAGTTSLYALGGDANSTLVISKGGLKLGGKAGAAGEFDLDLDPVVGKAATVSLTALTGAAALTVGDQGTGTFKQAGGLLDAKEGDVVIGQAGKGTYDQEGGKVHVANNLIVGNADKGNGTYTLDADSKLNVDGNATIGAQTGSQGTFNFNSVHNGDATFELTGSLTVGDKGKGTFNHGTGDLTTKLVVGAQAGGDGTYNLDGGTLTSRGNELIGELGKGVFQQSDGTNKVKSDLLVGHLATGKGTYTLGGDGKTTIDGRLTVGVEAGSEGTFNLNLDEHSDAATLQFANAGVITVGDAGKGTFVHRSGDVSADVTLGSQKDSDGTYKLLGGTLVTTGALMVGDAGTGKVQQSSGTDQVGAGLIVGNAANGVGTYTLSGDGKLTVRNDLTIGAGAGATGTFDFDPDKAGTVSLTVDGQVVVGNNGTGQFNQSGGDLTLKLAIGRGASGVGTYALGGGSLKDDLIVGDAGHGTFTNSGGKHTVDGPLTVGKQNGAVGTYNLSGTGSQTVSGAVVLGSEIGSSGTYTLTGASAKLDAAKDLVVGSAGTGTFAVSGAGTATVIGTVALGSQKGGTGTLGLDTGGKVIGKEVDVGLIGNGTVNITGAGSQLTTTDMKIGGGSATKVEDVAQWTYTADGVGKLVVTNNGYAAIDHTVTVLGRPGVPAAGAVPAVPPDPDVISISLGGSVEIGGHAGAKANTLTVDAGGTLVGHGRVSVETTVGVFGTIVNNGTIEAKDGLLVLRGNFDKASTGTVQIDDQSTVEIDGAFFGTVKFNGPTAAGSKLRHETTLRLDHPELFKGTIKGLQAGDTIDITMAALQAWTGSASDIVHTKVSGGQLTITMGDGKEKSLALEDVPAGGVFTLRDIGRDATGAVNDYGLTFQLANPKISGGSAGGAPVAGAPVSNGYIDTLVWGWGAWNTTKSISYWFGSAADVPAAVAVHGQTTEVPFKNPNLGVWNATEKADFTAALAAYAAVSNLTFVQAASVSDADLVWWLTPGFGPLGRSEIPAQVPGGQLWSYFDDTVWTATPGNPAVGPQQLLFGGDGNNTIVHEIGHSLGLAHPHDGGAEPGAQPFPGVPGGASQNAGTNGQNQSIFSVMSYFQGWTGQTLPLPPAMDQGTQGALGAFDIAALQVLYGENKTYKTGNDVYTLPSVAGAGTGWMSLWDAGGVDTISNAGSATSCTIDLRAATLVDPTDKAANAVLAANAGGYVSWVSTVLGGFTIAQFTLIENAIGGSGADTITGNAASNIIDGGGGKDVLTGGPGADTFILKPGYGIPKITDYSPHRGDVVKIALAAVIAAEAAPDTGEGDIINLSAFFTAIPDFAALAAHASQAGDDLVIDLGNGDSLTVENFAFTDLGDQGFHFGPLPTVTSMPATTDTHSTVASAGQTVTVTLNASAPLTVFGTPALQLDIGALATYSGGSGTGTITFSYIVQPGDNVADLKVTGLDLPTGAAIWDFFGSSLSGPVASDLGVQIDTTVSAATVTAASAVGSEGNAGPTSFSFTVSLSQAVASRQTLDWMVSGSGSSPADAADFTGGVLPSGTVTFMPGESSKTVTVLVAGDTGVEANEGFTVSLSNPSSGLLIGTASATGTIQNDDVLPVTTHGDAYVVQQGQSLSIAASVLLNDQNASTASLLSGPAHGTFQLAANGSFDFAPSAGFSGVDSFTYHASNGASGADGLALLYVVPVNVGVATTLDLLALDAEEQIAATYAAFFGRAADADGFEFWVGEFNRGLPVQGPAPLFANIASSFGVGAEARSLYPFLVNPFGASDPQISAFIESVYNNLFNRSSDVAGLAYWTGQIKQTLQAGQFVGSVLINIMSGAQDTADGHDITSLMGKVAVSLAYVHEQEEHHTAWAGASDLAAATNLLHAVTADPQSVLLGVRNAELLIAAHA